MDALCVPPGERGTVWDVRYPLAHGGRGHRRGDWPRVRPRETPQAEALLRVVGCRSVDAVGRKAEPLGLREPAGTRRRLSAATLLAAGPSADDPDRVRAEERGAIHGPGPQDAHRVAELEARYPRIEVADEVEQPIPVHVLRARTAGPEAGLESRPAKRDGGAVDLARGIEGHRGQDRDGNVAPAPVVDSVLVTARLDVDLHLIYDLYMSRKVDFDPVREWLLHAIIQPTSGPPVKS